MIFAVFGTNPYPFERLVGFLERLVQEGGYEIVAQTGVSRKPKGCHSFSFSSYKEMQKWMSEADIIIAQGGYGSCLDGLILGRPLLLVPRLRQFGECLDDQVELADHLASKGYVKCGYTYSEVKSAIEEITQERTDISKKQGEPPGRAVARVISAFIANIRRC